ncbi:UNVERIFIED_CONTAM: hypothetical protein Sangu_1467800 [Sesamum angustifolium]|uniref:Tf2-1-like SH3-like domain-containing protein n=1 Tax=Sesamum angustifolium TaxID=2727405 RepID=A0AAW2N7D1_9LAMI
MYGRNPQSIVHYLSDGIDIAAIEDLVFVHCDILNVVKYVSHKLGRHYFGHFHTLRRIGSMAYELELSIDARIHLVFHVSILKPFHGNSSESCGSLPPESMSAAPHCRSLQILGRCTDFSVAYPAFDLGGMVQTEWGCNDKAQSLDGSINNPAKANTILKTQAPNPTGDLVGLKIHSANPEEAHPSTELLLRKENFRKDKGCH